MSRTKHPIKPSSAETGLLWPVLGGLVVVIGLIYLFGAEDILHTVQYNARSWGEGLVNLTTWR